MKLILKLLLCAILYANIAHGQQVDKSDFVGIWQFGSQELNAGWFDNYQFFLNGNFCFNTNQNDATKRIISIGGTYKIKGDTLILQTTYSKEIQGGCLVRSETAGGSGWEIKGGKIITSKFKSAKVSYLQIESCKDKEKVPCILLDKRKHYKLESDPNNYN